MNRASRQPPSNSSLLATTPIRIAIIAPSLRQIVGGQEVQASILLSRWATEDLVRASFVPTVPELPVVLEWINRVRYLRTFVRFPKYLFNLGESIRQVEIVHAFSASFTSFLLATLPAWVVARLLKKRILINYRSGRGAEHLSRSRIARFVLKNSDAVVVPSKYLVEAFSAYGVPAIAIPNVVDSGEFKYRNRNRFRPWLICTRNFASYYGIDIVIRAFARVLSEFPEARLCLVGTGKCEAELRHLALHLNVPQVEFIGRMPPNMMPSRYDDSDIFINGSSIDNAPSSIIEAFCCGLPVVSTNAGGIRHLVRHESTGLLSEPGDWVSLAENVIRLVRDQGLARKLVANGRRAAQQHAWAIVRGHWLTIYQTLREGAA
jgi:glycosyltransferase involved in cell wall biosynthesis